MNPYFFIFFTILSVFASSLYVYNTVILNNDMTMLEKGIQKDMDLVCKDIGCDSASKLFTSKDDKKRWNVEMMCIYDDGSYCRKINWFSPTIKDY